MIFLTKDGLEKNERLKKIIEEETQTIYLMIESQNIKKNILADTMQRFADYTESNETNTDKNDSIIFFLNNFKNSLALSKTNIFLLENLLNMLKEVESVLDKYTDDKIIEIEKYNLKFVETNDIVLNNTIQIEQTLNHILSFSEFNFNSKNKLTKLINNISNKTISIQENIKEKLQEEKNNIIDITPIDENLIKEFDKEEHPENTLIVSEKEGTVILPFNIFDLNKIYKENKDKYSSLKQIIDEKYTVPFDTYKNPALARFREAFKLMRIKEKETVKKAFELGMELFFNYNLHPAIISACKSLDELDIYLDYLEENETQKFDCFKIIFDMAPIEVKQNKFNLFGKRKKEEIVEENKTKDENIKTDKEVAEEILGVELESKTLEIDDIKEETKAKVDVDLNVTKMNIEELEEVVDREVEIDKIVISNEVTLKRNEDYNLFEELKSEVNEKVDLEDTSFKEVNKSINLMEGLLNESLENAPEKENIVVPETVKTTPKKTTKEKNEDNKKDSKSKTKKTKKVKQEKEDEEKNVDKEEKEEKIEKEEKETKKVTSKTSAVKKKATASKSKKVKKEA